MDSSLSGRRIGGRIGWVATNLGWINPERLDAYYAEMSKQAKAARSVTDRIAP
jgi:hypothetical protein